MLTKIQFHRLIQRYAAAEYQILEAGARPTAAEQKEARADALRERKEVLETLDKFYNKAAEAFGMVGEPL